MKLTFQYPSSNDNGNLAGQTILRGGNTIGTQSYAYDGVNRLKSASEGAAWSQSFVYDPVGNRSAPNSGISQPVATGWNCSTNPLLFDCNNRLKILNAYDGAGNMIYLPNSTISQQYLTYDAENRLTVQTVAGSAPGALTNVQFAYDGDGRRVMKTVGSVKTVYVYEPEGSLAASYQYGGAAGASGTYYANQDHLGSTRLVTQGGVAKACHDYTPFGEEIPGGPGTRAIPCYGPVVTQEKFTGQVRDTESGLDLLGARYLASSLGRFMSPDPGGAGAGAGNPQSWNMYGYALNNPFKFEDPSGTTCVSTQTENSDGTVSAGLADNGDGTGCEAAGVGYGFGTNPITSQQVNVNGKQGSWLDYLWATTFNRIPQDYSHDVPLNPFAQQLFKAIGQKISVYPELCGGGGYLYYGADAEAGPIKTFAGRIHEWDSQSGLSSGSLFETGLAVKVRKTFSVVAGAGQVYSGGNTQDLGYAGLSAGDKSGASAGGVAFGSLEKGQLSGLGIYGEVFHNTGLVGGGAYINLTNLGSCR